MVRRKWRTYKRSHIARVCRRRWRVPIGDLPPTPGPVRFFDEGYMDTAPAIELGPLPRREHAERIMTRKAVEFLRQPKPRRGPLSNGGGDV